MDLDFVLGDYCRETFVVFAELGGDFVDSSEEVVLGHFAHLEGLQLW